MKTIIFDTSYMEDGCGRLKEMDGVFLHLERGAQVQAGRDDTEPYVVEGHTFYAASEELHIYAKREHVHVREEREARGRMNWLQRLIVGRQE